MVFNKDASAFPSAIRSTETALVDLTDLIQKSLEDKETAAYAFIDIEGAFDNSSHEAI